MALIDNITHNYIFDETSGDLIDQVGSMDGTVSGADYEQAGIINDGFNFDGANDKVTLTTAGGEVAGWSDGVSWNVWFYADTFNNSDVILGIPETGAWGNIRFINESGDLCWAIAGGTQAKSLLCSGVDPSTLTGGWHMVTGTTDGTDQEIFIDGVSKATQTRSDWVNFGAELTIGVFSGANSFDGRLDEFSIWDKELTSSEVTELYNSGAGLAYPFTSLTGLQINIGDVWKEVPAMQINIGDAWKAVAGIQLNIGDVWKTVL